MWEQSLPDWPLVSSDTLYGDPRKQEVGIRNSIFEISIGSISVTEDSKNLLLSV